MDISKLLDKHGHGILCFSAGKDSLACLQLLRPHLDRITLVWVDAGASAPETLTYMRKVAASVPHFRTVHGRQPQVVKEFGWPADVVPARGTLAGSYGAGPRPVMFQPYTDCCARSMWEPLSSFIRTCGTDLVILGQRKQEALRNRLRDEVLQVIGGVTYFQPLNDWDSDEVWQYLEASGLELPPFYAEGAESSVDCWNCTAYLDHNQSRLRRMQETEPERFAPVARVLTELQLQLRADVAPLDNLLRT
jgi:phosphoadenosine phosphosulfate reductase